MKKSNNFAIIIDTAEQVPSLINIINELHLTPRQQKVNLKELLFGRNELLVFDKTNAYDYELADNSPLILSWLGNIFGPRHYKVSKNFNEIVEELYLFAGKEPKKEKNNMTVNIEISLPRTQKPKPKRKVRVFSNFVKVGFDQYSIKIDPYTGYEYVKIDGKRYEIARDIFSRGVLVEI